MEFPERLAALRKERGMTQQALANLVGITVLQVHRYESGSSQPTLGVIRRLAVALGVSADVLVFDAQERGPSEALRYQFETLARLPEHDQEMVRDLIDAVIVKNQVAGALERVALASKAKPAPAKKAPPARKPSGKRSAHANASE
jgi:transcriptional regulator with XRE-family HTH domain